MPEHIFDEDRQPEKENNNLPDDLHLDWSDDMSQISGFAGKTVEIGDMTLQGTDYENDCRRMVERCVQWMLKRYGPPPKNLSKQFNSTKGYLVYTFHDGDETEFKNEMTNKLADGAKHGATGAMVVATFGHAMLLWHVGWDDYKAGMLKWKDTPEMGEVYDKIIEKAEQYDE